jgi:hypothetical protein
MIYFVQDNVIYVEFNKNPIQLLPPCPFKYMNWEE